MKKIVKILYVNGGILDNGGISSYMMNFYRCFDKSKIHIDFLTQGAGSNMYVEEIEATRGKVYQIPNKSTNLIKNATMLYRIIKNGKYDIVHAHSDAGNGFVLMVAKLAHVGVRISHSHSTDFYTKSKIKRFINSFEKRLITRYANVLWGCSEASCKWLYPNSKDYCVVNNAIDLKKFAFNDCKRIQIREKLGLSDRCLALCQVGHFSYIKNQEYSLKIIKNLKEEHPTTEVKLFLIGDGENRETIENMINQIHIDDSVELMGIRHDVSDLLQAMDVMLLPSLFEGFPVTLVESQASGLYSVVSENITKSVSIDDSLVKFLPIGEKYISKWVKACIEKPEIDRSGMMCSLQSAGFDIETEARKLQEKYLNLVGTK